MGFLPPSMLDQTEEATPPLHLPLLAEKWTSMPSLAWYCTISSLGLGLLEFQLALPPVSRSQLRLN